MLHSLGVEVLDERPYRIDLGRAPSAGSTTSGWSPGPELLHSALDQDMDAALTESAPTESSVGQRFTSAFTAVWFGRAEADNFNELVLRARLGWREVAILRAYARYLRQAGFPYSQFSVARVLLTRPEAAREFVALFEAV